MTSVSLITGDPANEPASFTRFVLPFVWSLEPFNGGVPQQTHFRKVALPRLADRRGYLTPETADVLFDRAQWLELNAPRSSTTLYVGNRAIEAEIAAPRVVLFEANAAETPEQPILCTGFLLLDLSFPKRRAGADPVTLDDLLVVNELFRYWRPPFEGHADKSRTIADRGTVTYQSFLRDLCANGDGYIGRWAQFLSYPAIGEENRMRALTTESARDAAAKWTEKAEGDTGWIAQTDERAFVWTCALTKYGAGGETEKAAWIRLLNVDAPSDGPATPFEVEWGGSRTYERWEHYGTLYGFNSHCGAMLGQACQEPPTWRHFREIYFDQVLLLLYLRAATFRFSRRLSEVSEHLQRPHGEGAGFREFRKLHRSFAFLTNLYRFPLLSSQQQGIEMYACARKALDVDELFEEVRTEIESTHGFFEMANTAATARTTTFLTYVATVLGVLGVILGFLSTQASKPVLQFLEGIPYLPADLNLLLIGLLLSIVVIGLSRPRDR